jgi:hypothetical protein
MMISSGSGMRVLLHPVPLVEMPAAIVHPRLLVQITPSTRAETYGQSATKKNPQRRSFAEIGHGRPSPKIAREFGANAGRSIAARMARRA